MHLFLFMSTAIYFSSFYGIYGIYLKVSSVGRRFIYCVCSVYLVHVIKLYLFNSKTVWYIKRTVCDSIVDFVFTHGWSSVFDHSSAQSNYCLFAFSSVSPALFPVFSPANQLLTSSPPHLISPVSISVLCVSCLFSFPVYSSVCGLLCSTSCILPASLEWRSYSLAPLCPQSPLWSTCSAPHNTSTWFHT